MLFDIFTVEVEKKKIPSVTGGNRHDSSSKNKSAVQAVGSTGIAVVEEEKQSTMATERFTTWQWKGEWELGNVQGERGKSTYSSDDIERRSILCCFFFMACTEAMLTAR